MNPSDTIVAISSAVGPAARMIVRASGPLVQHIHRELTSGAAFVAGNAARLSLQFADVSVPAWVYCFGAGRSVTGEDVVEFHIPGNPLLARMLLDEIVRLGARQAEPGEFTARAYLNGRIDLAEAEGVAATIAAQSERELAAARQLMAGELARRLRPVLDAVAETLGLIEVGIDFSEEDVSFISADQVRARITSADAALSQLLAESSRFERLTHEPRIVLVGRPNAGKSTLLNALAGHDRAIVSPHAGTTRDAIWSHVRLRRGMVRVIDVAGVEQDAADDAIARAMQTRAHQTIEEADLVVLVHDCTDERALPALSRASHLLVHTKVDLKHDANAQGTCSLGPSAISISAATGENLDTLRHHLDDIAFGPSSPGSAASLALNARHVQAISEARDALARAPEHLPTAGSEVVAMELREALDALGRVLGSVSPDDVLGRIFSTFCIGK